MSYNPFEKSLLTQKLILDKETSNTLDLKQSIKSRTVEITECGSSILAEDEWRQLQNLGDLLQEKSELATILQKAESDLKRAQLEERDTNKDLKLNKENVGSLLNPLNWFSSDRSSTLKIIDGIELKLKNLKSITCSHQKEKDKIKSNFEELLTNITRYNNYENFLSEKHETRRVAELQINSLNSKLVKTENLVELLQKDFNDIKQRWTHANQRLEPITRKINDCYKSIQMSQNSMDHATRLSTRLSETKNSFERKQVHIQCEQEIGNGNPNTVIEQFLAKIEHFKRSLEKLNLRAERISAVQFMSIKQLIIDGNNIMNQSGKFIGLKPVLAITEFLRNEYELFVVFDPGACNVLSKTEDEIREQFHASVNVHIATSTADDTILELAEVSDSAVISRDSYQDFPEKQVVIDERIFKPEIVNNYVYLHDLDLKIPF